MTKALINALEIGVPLYVPGDHPRLGDTISGAKCTGAGCIFVCLEDALRFERSRYGEERLLEVLKTQPTPLSLPVFCRPRDLDQLARLADSPFSVHLAGFVLPKVSPESWERSVELTNRHGGWLIPILETAMVFRPSKLEAMLDSFLASKDRLLAARMGGTDLAGLLGTRRAQNISSHHGPIGSSLAFASSMLKSHGISVSGVVFEHLEDFEGLAKEAVKDAAGGLIPKAAVHPDQVEVIIAAYRVHASDAERAKEILASDAPAVFRSNGVMAEPASHAPWARTIIERQRIFGSIPILAEANDRHPIAPTQ